MRTTLIENWKTSLLGLFLVGAGLYTGLNAKQSWTESGPIILSGIGLIFSKDATKTSIETLAANLKKNE